MHDHPLLHFSIQFKYRKWLLGNEYRVCFLLDDSGKINIVESDTEI